MVDHISNVTGVNESAPWLWSGAAGVMGRLMFHAMMVQRRKRKPFSWVLFCDLPIALCMGWSAYGISEFYHLPFATMMSAAMIGAYLGPYSIDRLFARLGDKYFGPEPDTTGE